MPTRLILHIGRAKTGTTALQRYLRDGERSLARQGILFPETGRLWIRGRLSEGQHLVALQCNPRHHERAKYKRLKVEFAEEAEGWDTVLLSSEAFQNLRDLSLLKRFFDDFTGYHVTIVCYLREYLSYLISSYRQMIQNQPQFQTFAEHCTRNLRIETFLERWKLIGETVFRPFEPGRLKGADIIDDFLNCIGAERDPTVGCEMSNPSIGGNLLFFRLVENRFRLEQTDNRAAEAIALNHAPFRRAFHLSDQNAAKIRARSDYNRMVEAEIGALPLVSFGDEPPVPILETLDDDLVRVYSGSRLATMRVKVEASLDDGRGWLACAI